MHNEIPIGKVCKAINRYNMYRSKEANARLISIEGGKITVEFTGSFCYSCGFYDWIDDLKYELMDELNRNVKITSIEEIRLGVYSVVYTLD